MRPLLLLFAALALAPSAACAQAGDAPSRWVIPAYGLIVDQQAGQTMLFADSAGTCAPIGALRGAAAEDISVEQTAAGPVLINGVSRYLAQPIAAVPAACAAFRPVRDNRRTFDALWANFADHYPFFARRGVDWTADRDAARARAVAARNDAALWDVLTALMAPLRDIHVTLVNGNQRWSASRIARSTTPDPDGIIPNGRALQAGLLAWLRGAQSPLVAPPTVSAGGYLIHGRTRSGACYLAVLEMTDYAGDDHSDAENAAVLATALDQIAADCAGASATILDLRYNPGGDDRHGIAIAARIARQPYVAYTKRAYRGGEWTAAYPVSVVPSPRPALPARVAVLIGPKTNSAAETTALALRSSGAATLVGSNAQGALSDALTRILPNGWVLTLSNEEYTAPDGTVFEGVGVPPDIAVAEPTDSIDARFGTALRRAEAVVSPGL
jgi:hypothetical protein